MNPLRSRWSPFVIYLVLLMLLAGPGCWVQPAAWVPWSPEPTAESRRVVLFGDSLGAMAKSTVMGPEHAADRQGESWSYNASGGTQVVHWLDAMASVTAQDDVVFELLTNDLSALAINTGQLGAAIETGFQAVSAADCVVVLTINTTSGDLRGFPFDQRTRWVNDRLRERAALGQIQLYDWDAVSMGRTDWLSSDNLHYNTVGTKAYAQALLDAAEMCA